MLCFDLCRKVFGLEIYQTAGVLPVFKDMHDGIGRPFTLITGVVAACAACPAVFQRSRRWDLLLGKHTGDFGRSVPGLRHRLYICLTTGAASSSKMKFSSSSMR